MREVRSSHAGLRIHVVAFILLGLSGCSSQNDSAKLGERLLAEQEAKEGTNQEHYKVQEEAARLHKDK